MFAEAPDCFLQLAMVVLATKASLPAEHVTPKVIRWSSHLPAWVSPPQTKSWTTYHKSECFVSSSIGSGREGHTSVGEKVALVGLDVGNSVVGSNVGARVAAVVGVTVGEAAATSDSTLVGAIVVPVVRIDQIVLVGANVGEDEVGDRQSPAGVHDRPGRQCVSISQSMSSQPGPSRQVPSTQIADSHPSSVSHAAPTIRSREKGSEHAAGLIRVVAEIPPYFTWQVENPANTRQVSSLRQVCTPSSLVLAWTLSLQVTSLTARLGQSADTDNMLSYWFPEVSSVPLQVAYPSTTHTVASRLGRFAP